MITNLPDTELIVTECILIIWYLLWQEGGGIYRLNENTEKSWLESSYQPKFINDNAGILQQTDIAKTACIQFMQNNITLDKTYL